jgi:hypothetical protein
VNKSKDQFRRLLRGAATARQSAPTQSAELPEAAWLMARTQDRERISSDIFVILRRGLAAACILLLATGIVAAREIREQQAGVMNLAVGAPFEIARAFVP